MTKGVKALAHQPAADRACAPSGLSQSALSQAQPLVPCAECERLREEIADYMGHRTDNVAGKVWAARFLFSIFEEELTDLIGDFGKLGHDDYDQSLEIYEVPADVRLGEAAQRLIRDAGFHKVYVNHGDPKEEGRWETHYTFGDAELPVRGWRRRYVSDPAVETTRVIIGPEDNGYYEISFWPKGWDGERMKGDLERGYYRIVPDPLDPFAASGMEAATAGETPKSGSTEGDSPVPKADAQKPSKHPPESPL